MTKLQNLKNEISKFDNLAVAFSGGVDSSFLLKIASEVLNDKVLAVTIKSLYMSDREIKQAVNFTKKYNIKHKIIDINLIESIKHNPQNRCYICKKYIFSILIQESKKLGFNNFADGTNKDDLSEIRPGIKAAHELGVVSPLISLTKKEIREFSKTLNLSTHNKPSYACLLTRLPYGYGFSKKDLDLIESVENLLIQNNYQNIRARFDGRDIKLQMLYLDMLRFIQDDNFKKIIKAIQNMGVNQIMLDLKGLREDVLK